jgi:hypothetical protein
MRSLTILFVIGLLSVGGAGCGGANRSLDSSHRASSDIGHPDDASPSIFVWPKPRHLLSIATTRRYIGDPGLSAGVIREDSRILAFYGHAADAVDRRAVTAVVKRYYAVAKVGNGKVACSMIAPGLLKAIPLDYGQFGAQYLHGAKTCQAVLSRLFKHTQRELAGWLIVTGVLVKGDRAYGLLGSSKMPASMIMLVREHGAWRIDAPLGGPIPVAK